MTILCPVCQSSVTAVIESRSDDGRVKRRRECDQKHRFITHETVSHVVGQNRSSPRPRKGDAPHRTPARDRIMAALPPEKRARAEGFFKAGWTAKEVAPLFDLVLSDLPNTPLT